jgi:hypothetical protein
MRYFFAPSDQRWTRTQRAPILSSGMQGHSTPALIAALTLFGCQRVAAPGFDDQPDAAVVACTITAPTACPDPAPRYAEVAPIIGQHCASPCHWGAPGGPWPLTDYPHVADWQDVVRDDLLDCSMPPPEANSTITDAERTAILVWIRCGAPE